MGDLMDRIGRLNSGQRTGIAVAIYGLLVLALWFLSLAPMREEIVAQQARQVKLEEERDETREIAENRDSFEKEVERLNEELAKAIKELPNEREIPELLRRISSIGKKIGLEFLLFQPLPETPMEFYADVPVKLEIEGSYHEVATFFDRIGKLNRIVNIRDIIMSDPFERSGKIILKTGGTAVTYRFLSESEVGASQRRTGRPRR